MGVSPLTPAQRSCPGQVEIAGAQRTNIAIDRTTSPGKVEQLEGTLARKPFFGSLSCTKIGLDHALRRRLLLLAGLAYLSVNPQGLVPIQQRLAGV